MVSEHRIMYRVLLHVMHKKRSFSNQPVPCPEKDEFWNEILGFRNIDRFGFFVKACFLFCHAIDKNCGRSSKNKNPD